MSTETIAPDWMAGFKPQPQRPRRTKAELAEAAAAKDARAAEQAASGVEHVPAAIPGVQGFLKNRSGNPRGRPKGSKDKRTILLEQLQDAGQEITNVVIEQARAGDLSAAALVWQRILPPLKAQAAPVAFQFDRSATLLEQGGSILAAVASGQMDADTARALIGCLSTLAGLKIDELDERMAALEDRLKGRVL